MPAREAFVLVGPTASGKSDVAQLLAEKMQAAILSADSMLVYQGMDIGTAKPSIAARSAVPYLGVDLVTPDQDFDVWHYVQIVGKQLAALPSGMSVVVVGGSGLYVKALLQGLDSYAAEPIERERWEQLFAEKGVEGLQAVLQEQDPTVLAGLADPRNPRRLIRAIERVCTNPHSRGAPRSWKYASEAIPFAGLLPENLQLRDRIATRVEKMYAAGLLLEAQKLREDYTALSSTASQAIGYNEAFALLDGKLDAQSAKERTMIRTNRLAKRQRTWFRHQATVDWCAPGDKHDVAALALEVENIWRKYGPVQLRLA